MNSIARLTKTAKLLSVFGIVLTIAPYIYAFTAVGGINGTEVVFSLLMPLVLIVVGYLLQSLAGHIIKFRRISDSFDDNIKYVDLRACALPLILSVAAFFPLFTLYRSYSLAADPEMDALSLSLYTVPLMAVVSLILGVVLWFYPYHKLIHVEMVYGYGAIYLIITIITAIFGLPMTLLTVCFCLFLAVFFTVSNLKSIEESISASKFRIPENNFRKYNFELIFKHYLLTLALAVVVFSLIVVSLDLINQTRVTPIDIESQESQQYGDKSEGSEPSRKPLFPNANSKGDSVVSAICTVVVVTAFAVFTLYWLYRKHLLKRFFALVVLMLEGIKEFFLGFFDLFTPSLPADSSVPASYVDTPVDVDCVVQYRDYVIKEEVTYKNFDAKLAALPTLEERYAFVYRLYVSLVRGHRYGVKLSDTPRAVTAKMSAQRRFELIDATPVYEDIRYRELKPDSRICERELKELAAIVKSML